MSNQHAREWITPEMTRRLMHHYLDKLPQDDERVTKIVDSTELWFVLSANPDGYDYTYKTPPTACGARTCRTSTATARSPPVTAST